MTVLSREQVAELQIDLDYRFIWEFASRTYPGSALAFSGFRGALPRQQPRIGSLHWPADASRFAVGHYAASEQQLALIRTYLSVPGNNGVGDLVINDGQNIVTAKNMAMLPARPLYRAITPTQSSASPSGLYLLTLVDQRFALWFNYSLGLTGSTWADLYTAIADALGITIGGDAVNSNYGTPPSDLTAPSTSLPLLLDSIAWLCGQRIVCQLDGTVEALNASTGATRFTANLARAARLAGDVFDLGAGSLTDLTRAMPQSVTVVFGQGTSGEASVTTSLSSAALTVPVLAGVTGFPGTKNLISAQSTTDSALAAQWAADWYTWQAYGVDAMYSGAVAWQMDGVAELVEYITDDARVVVRVQRGPWLDHPPEVPQASVTPPTPPPPPSCCTGATLQIPVVLSVVCNGTTLTVVPSAITFTNGAAQAGDGSGPYTGSYTVISGYSCATGVSVPSVLTLTFVNGLISPVIPSVTILASVTCAPPYGVPQTLLFNSTGQLIAGGGPAQTQTTFTGCTGCCPGVSSSSGGGPGCPTGCSTCPGGMPSQYGFALTGFSGAYAIFNGSFVLNYSSGCTYTDSTGIWSLNAATGVLTGTFNSLVVQYTGGAWDCACTNTLTLTTPALTGGGGGTCNGCTANPAASWTLQAMNGVPGTPVGMGLNTTGCGYSGTGGTCNSGVCEMEAGFAISESGGNWSATLALAVNVILPPLGPGQGPFVTSLEATYTATGSGTLNCCDNLTLNYDAGASSPGTAYFPSTATVIPFCYGPTSSPGSTPSTAGPMTVTLQPLNCPGTCSPATITSGPCAGQTLPPVLYLSADDNGGSCTGNYSLTWNSGASLYYLTAGQSVGTCTTSAISLNPATFTLDWNGTSIPLTGVVNCAPGALSLCYTIASGTCGCTSPVTISITQSGMANCPPTVPGGFSSPCCPGVLLPKTVYLSFASGACSETIPLYYDPTNPNGGWINSSVLSVCGEGLSFSPKIECVGSVWETSDGRNPGTAVLVPVCSSLEFQFPASVIASLAKGPGFGFMDLPDATIITVTG